MEIPSTLNPAVALFWRRGPAHFQKELPPEQGRKRGENVLVYVLSEGGYGDREIGSGAAAERRGWALVGVTNRAGFS